MKRLVLLLLLAGCDDGYLTGTTEWRVQLGDANFAICSGEMTLAGIDPTQEQQIVKLDGTWTCGGDYGPLMFDGRATGDIRDSGMTFLDLEMENGMWSGVRATYSAKRREIVGSIYIAGDYPFAAYMK